MIEKGIGDYPDILSNAIIRFSSVYRYSQLHLNKQECIAEHCMHVAFIAKIFYNLLTEEEQNSIDLNRCVSYLSTHDLPEIFTGDIPRPTKYSDKAVKSMLDKLEADLVTNFINSLPLTQTQGENLFKDIFGEFLNEQEHVFCKMTDIYVVLLKFYTEYMIGNRTVITEFNHAITTIYEYEIDSKYPKIYNNFIHPLIMKLKKFEEGC